MKHLNHKENYLLFGIFTFFKQNVRHFLSCFSFLPCLSFYVFDKITGKNPEEQFAQFSKLLSKQFYKLRLLTSYPYADMYFELYVRSSGDQKIRYKVTLARSRAISDRPDVSNKMPRL